MSRIVIIHCSDCNKDKEVQVGIQHTPTVCYDCQKKTDEVEKDAHFAELDKLSIEERLRRIELTLWHQSKHPPVSIRDMVVG